MNNVILVTGYLLFNYLHWASCGSVLMNMLIRTQQGSIYAKKRCGSIKTLRRRLSRPKWYMLHGNFFDMYPRKNCNWRYNPSWWRHQMETFSKYWPFVRVYSSHKGQWRGALMFSLICARINGWVNNRVAGDLRGYRAHYDFTVMIQNPFSLRSEVHSLPLLFNFRSFIILVS